MLLLLSSALAVRAMACANHFFAKLFLSKRIFVELIVFRHLNMEFTIFLNVILIKQLE